MDWIDHIISSYGLLAVFLGITIQGETIVFVAGIFAHRGDLDLWTVILIAFCGNIFSDNLFFNLGRGLGKPIIKIVPAIQKRVGKIKTLFHKHPLPIVILFRFMVGFRITAPLVIGMTGYSRLKFFLMDLISAFIWATTYASLGYCFGKLIEKLLDDADQYEVPIAIAILVLGIGGVIIHHYRHVKKRQEALRRLEEKTANEKGQ